MDKSKLIKTIDAIFFGVGVLKIATQNVLLGV